MGSTGEKKVKGRKPHVVSDVEGHILHVKVHAANLHDTVMGGPVFAQACERYPSLEGACADAGYRKTTEEFIQKNLRKKVDIIARPSYQKGWMLLPKRWVVERSFAWFLPFRRLAKDFERTCRSAENFIRISQIRLLIRRIAKQKVKKN